MAYGCDCFDLKYDLKKAISLAVAHPKDGSPSGYFILKQKTLTLTSCNEVFWRFWLVYENCQHVLWPWLLQLKRWLQKSRFLLLLLAQKRVFPLAIFFWKRKFSLWPYVMNIFWLFWLAMDNWQYGLWLWLLWLKRWLEKKHISSVVDCPKDGSPSGHFILK